MPFYTKVEARDAARRKVQESSKHKISSHVLNESFADAKDSDDYDIFLAHSKVDEDLVLGIKTILENQGLNVYVDWAVDPQASRDNITKKTAELLRKRMRQSKSLIYVATESASKSKWMPWELGFFDGLSKGLVAIMPLMDNPNASFQGQEYLGFYPLVQKNQYKSGKKDVFVEMRGEHWMTLKEFSTGNSSWKKY